MLDKLIILLIEDEDAHAELILRHLKTIDKYEVNWVKSISEAILFLQNETPNLILADWKLPDGNAIDILPKEKEKIKYPVIILTSFGSEITAVEVIKAGVLDYIVKSADSFKNIHFTIERTLREWDNITSRLNAEIALKESEKRFKNLVENSPIGIYRTTPEGKPLMANPSIMKTLGYNSFEELANSMDISKDGYLNMNDRQRFMETIEKDGIIRNFDAWWKDVHNKPILMRENAVAIKDKQGKTIYYEGTAEDITERKKAEEILVNNEKRFRYLIENADDVINIIDELGTIIYCTEIIENKWGYKSKDIVGKNFSEIIHPDDIANVKNTLDKLLQNTEYSIRVEYRLLHNSGKYIYVESIGANHLKNKLINGIVFTTREITQRKETEELKQNIAIAEKTAQIKQQFLANMSHEIRTPMNAIMGMLDLIKKTSLNETQADYIKTIKDASENLLNIINDILDLSKIEAGKMELKSHTFNIFETAKKIKKLFIESSKLKNIDFFINFSIDIPKYIKADEKRIIQIVSNLISNAFKFTKKGSITVNISLINKIDNNLQFLVEVIDTGIGITENDQLKLFTKFNQLDNSLTRSQEGTGLGLAISKELTEMMGGEIGVESKYGKGSAFWFSFNAILTNEKECESGINDITDIKDIKFEVTVLLVEDKFVNQKVATLMLQSAGCTVFIANNGREAIDLINSQKKFDIIFMDIQMPIMDGVEAVGILRKENISLPPIIALSANAMEGDAEKYIKLGMDDYLSKPFNIEQIKEKIFKWCKGIDK